MPARLEPPRPRHDASSSQSCDTDRASWFGSVVPSAIRSTTRGESRTSPTVEYFDRDVLEREYLRLDESWLADGERQEAARLTNPDRRREWRAGRFAAKWIVHRALTGRSTIQAMEFAAIDIRSRDAAGKSTRPTVRIAGRPHSVSLTISHTARGVLVGMSLDPRVNVGVDLVNITDGTPSLRAAWFTEHERLWVPPASQRLIAIVWGIKEAVYKAANADEPFAPRRYEVSRNADDYTCRDPYGNPADAYRITVRERESAITVVAIVRNQESEIRKPTAER